MQYLVTYDSLHPTNGPSRWTKVMQGSIDEILFQLQLAHGSWDPLKRETKRAVIHFINTERIIRDQS